MPEGVCVFGAELVPVFIFMALFKGLLYFLNETPDN